jgi:hypothetical protein
LSLVIGILCFGSIAEIAEMKIVVNGHEYSSADQLPPEAREAYDRAMGMLADRNGNGIPDVLEVALEKSAAASAGSSGPAMQIYTSHKIIVNGREYASLDEVPPETRRLLAAMQGRPGEKKAGWTDPLAPASRVPARGLLGTDPMTMVWIALLVAGILMVFILPLVALLWVAFR